MSESEGPQRNRKRPGVEVRQMEIDDIPKVFHLGERLFTSIVSPNLYRTWDEYEVTGMFQEEAEFCLVAELDEDIIGFALGTTITKAGSAWKYGHLIWLGVTEEYQRAGVAEKLFHEFTRIMVEHGVRILMVDTEAESQPAIDFFKKMGFGSPEEHIYLSLNLDQRLRKMKQKQAGKNGARQNHDD